MGLKNGDQNKAPDSTINYVIISKQLLPGITKDIETSNKLKLYFFDEQEDHQQLVCKLPF